MRPELQRGAQLFNAGAWWEAHEAWEGYWRQARGEDRHYVQALILLAAALHKRWGAGSLTHRNFHKATRYLDQLPPSYDGLDLSSLRAEVWTALHEVGYRPQLPLAVSAQCSGGYTG